MAVWPEPGKLATPMLTWTAISGLPSTFIGDSRSICRSFSATSRPLAGGHLRRMIANSSPPYRPSKSEPRTPALNTRATCISTWSPTKWPQVSLIRLK